MILKGKHSMKKKIKGLGSHLLINYNWNLRSGLEECQLLRAPVQGLADQRSCEGLSREVTGNAQEYGLPEAKRTEVGSTKTSLPTSLFCLGTGLLSSTLMTFFCEMWNIQNNAHNFNKLNKCPKFHWKLKLLSFGMLSVDNSDFSTTIQKLPKGQEFFKR